MHKFEIPTELKDIQYNEATLKAAMCDAGADPRYLEGRNVTLPMAVIQLTSELWLKNIPPTSHPLLWKAYLDIATDGFFHYVE